MRQGLSATSALRMLGAMFVVLGWCRVDWAQDIHLPQSRQGYRTAPILLLTRPDIQRELGLSPDLVASVQAQAREFRNQALALQGKAGAGVLMARRTIDDGQAQWLNKNLSQAQVERLHQLDLQWEGPGAFITRPVIAEYLNLNPQQRQAIGQSLAARIGRIKQGQKPLESEEAFHQKILTNLSEYQRNQWKALQGKPFHFLPDSLAQKPQSPQAEERKSR